MNESPATEKGREWSTYISYRSALNYVFALLGGFTFTSMTLLVTNLRGPQDGQDLQVVLLFASALLDLLIFLILLNTVTIFNYVERIPARRSTSLFSILMVSVIALWGYLTPSILLLFGQTAAGYAATAIWTLILLVGLIGVFLPFERRRKAR